MSRTMRDTGVEAIGSLSWGTHFCQFYQDKQDLIAILVPYFAAGLEQNEFCMWVTSEPLRVEEAKGALAKAVGTLDPYLGTGQIEVLEYSQWYTSTGKFEPDRVMQGWVGKLVAAQQRGFEGLRLSGNTFWLEESAWQEFAEYEAAVDRVIGQYPMLAICTYHLARCGAVEILEVMSSHAFALIKRGDTWQVIESAERKQAQEALAQANQRLLAAERARAELAEKMVLEISHRTKNNLMLLSGVLEMAALEEPEGSPARRVLRDAINRVAALVAVHEGMYRGSSGQVELLDLLRRIAEMVTGALAERELELSVTGDEVLVSSRSASSLSVVANELITNAIKHGGPDGEGKAHAVIRLSRKEGRLALGIWNSGKPVASDFDVSTQKGLGLTIAQVVVEKQMQGRFSLHAHEGGTLAEIVLDEDALKP